MKSNPAVGGASGAGSLFSTAGGRYRSAAIPDFYHPRHLCFAAFPVFAATPPHADCSAKLSVSQTIYRGFAALIVISVLGAKTLVLLRANGLGEDVFVLLYSLLGLIQFMILLTILSIPFGILIYVICNRLILISSGYIELLDPRVVNRDILPKNADISALVGIELPPEPIAKNGDDTFERKKSAAMRCYPLLRNLMGILIAATLFFWVIELWRLDLPVGRTVFRSALSIFATFLLAYAAWEICRTIIDRKLEEDGSQSPGNDDDAEAGAEGSRKGTLLTLLRKFILTLIAIVVILSTLNAVEINIGPLLAGSVILGLAIGFGSQTLVKDILSGVFSLIFLV